MKTMIYSLALAAFMSLSSCNDNDDPILTQKDWDGTATYFASTDEQFTTYYKPYVGYVGDPMPFYDPIEQNFKILYLQEFRPNQEATYHPIWGVSTKNVDSYQSLGEVISTGNASEADAAIGTGSTIYNDSEKLYYTFYTGHTANQEVVMMATSSDFKTWTKSKIFYLQGNDYGYSVKDFRDPFVFKGDDGIYHMIVSTMQGTKGVLAEFVSSDLKSWEHKGVFMSMMWDRFYECPDVFKMGDWWYLVYSEKHVAIRKVQYFKGRTLDELKAVSAVCRQHQIPEFLVGARLGYGLAARDTDVTLKDIASLCDIFYIGGTKVGALFGEAVVIPQPGLIRQFDTIVKQRGVLLAKGRLLGLQFDTLFTDGLYLKIARHAIDMADRIVEGLKVNGYTFYIRPQSNQLFVQLENSLYEKLAQRIGFEVWEKRADGTTVVRIATSWATREEDVAELLEELKNK